MSQGLDFQGTRRYRPIRLLGMGGMGAVYEVVDALTQGRLALKVMLTHQPQRLLRFKQEFRVIAELHHKNLVRLFDLGQEAGRWFFTMELLEGCDLLERLRPAQKLDEATIDPASSLESPASEEREPPAPASICDLPALHDTLAQILDALEFLHQHGLVHRDLKPSNILVERSGVVRLLDFGLAGHVEEAIAGTRGALRGTLSYMSPEQCSGKSATPASDLYALGCMMFQLLTGQLPFVGTPSQIIHARLNRAPPRVQRRVSGVPHQLAEICHRLMSRSPSDRPSLREVRATLLQSSTSHLRDDVGPRVAQRHAEKSLPFIGRANELTALHGCLDRAAAADLQWVLLSGDSGIGKSALAAELTAEAERRGFVCLSGRCYEREQVPFVAFDRAVDALIGTLASGPAERRAAIADSLEMLRPVFPAVGVLFDSPRNGSPSPLTQDAPDPREQYRRAAAGLCQVVEYCQAQAPLLLVLDDLQWADEQSIELLAALLTQCSGRVLIAGLTRREGTSTERPLHRLLPLASCVIALHGLTPTELARLAEEVAGAGQADAKVQSLLTRSEGNPFLALQLLGHLTTPTLSARAEQLLSAAATAGGDSSRRLLAAASGLSVADFELALAELLSARLLKALPAPAVDGTLDRLDLYHDRIRETTYLQLPLDRRRTLHRALAQTLETLPSSSGPPFEALLRHWTEAGDRDKRRHFTGKAAEQAEGKLAFRRAAQLFRSLLDEPEPDETPLVTAARWERVGILCEYSGQLSEACEAFKRALSIWEDERRAEDDEPRNVALLRLRGRVAENLMANRRIAEGRAVYAQGLSGLGLRLERPLPLQLSVIAGLQLHIAWTELTRIWPWHTSREATPLERAQLQFFAEMVRAMALLWVLPSVEAMTRCEVLARRFADRRLLHQITVSKVFGNALLRPMRPRELARAHKILDEAQELATVHNVPLGKETVQVTRSLIFFWSRDHVRARHENEAAQAGLTKQGLSDGYDCVVARMVYMHILFEAGDHDSLLTVIAREQAGPHVNFYNAIMAHSFKARVLAQRGRYLEADSELTRTRELLAAVPPCNLMIFPALSSVAVAAASGNFLQALIEDQRTQRLLRKLSGPISGFIRSSLQEGFLESALGLCRQGRLPRATRLRAKKWAHALAQNGVLDVPCMGHRALALLAMDEGDEDAAKKSLACALSWSRVDTNPYRRWLCLRTAQQLHAETPELRREAEVLVEKHRFVSTS